MPPVLGGAGRRDLGGADGRVGEVISYMETFEHVVVVVLLPALDLVGGVYPQLLPDCELPLLQGKLVLPPHLAGLLRGLLVGDFGHFEGTVDGANQQLIGLQLLLPGI